MENKDFSLEDFFYVGDSLLLKAYSREIYYSSVDDIPKGIVSEMEDLKLIKVERGRLELLLKGKRAINAGGLENFFKKKSGYKFFIHRYKYPLLLTFIIITILVALMIYGYIHFENYMIGTDVDGYVNET